VNDALGKLRLEVVLKILELFVERADDLLQIMVAGRGPLRKSRRRGRS
jgi:hypothetical protein